MQASKRKLLPLAIALAFASGASQAVLERVGPISNLPSDGGYPAWYQDTTGLALEFCAPGNQSEVDGGWCLLLPPDVPIAPEVFPTFFFDEHFYFAAGAAAPANNGIRALLTLAEEAAFAADVVPGGQMTFSRIRVVLNPVPVTGTYRFIHPYGEESLQGVAGGKIFFTDDVGISCPPGQFDCSLASRVGPFLLPSATPGGAEMPPLTADNPEPDTDPNHFGGAFAATPYPGTGKAYIADPSRIGPVTGSPLPNFTDSTGASRNHNIFRIEGPAGAALGLDANGAVVDWVETSDFSLMGRVYTGTIPSRITVDRASYAASDTQQKVTVFATASDTTQARIPAQPKPAGVTPQLTYYDAPCAGVLDPVTGATNPPYTAPAGVSPVQMFSIEPGLHTGQSSPTAIPNEVCVNDSAARDANGNIVALYVPKVVTDEVDVTSAVYDRSAGTLTVTATSSDTRTNLKPVLSLTYGNKRQDLTNGSTTVANLIASPSRVTVTSSALGEDRSQVKTAFNAAPPPSLPVASNDSFTLNEDCLPTASATLCATPQVLNILANDANVAGGTVTLTSAPRLGSATLNAIDGTVSYRPNLNASGADQFTYTVTVGAQVSNTGTVTINITPVNDAPVATNDTALAVRNWPRNIKVTANDTDPDGAADIAGALLVTGPLAGTTESGVNCDQTTGFCSFTPSATASSISFTYKTVDKLGTQSANNGTVTVTVSAAEQVNMSRADYTRANSRLRVVGTTTPAMGQTMNLVFVNSAGAQVGPTLATAIAVDGTGNWTFDQSGIALPAGAITVRATSSNPDNTNHTVRAQSLSIK